MYSGPSSDKPVEIQIKPSEFHLEWPYYDTGRSTKKSQTLCEIVASQQWSGVERQLVSEGYGTHIVMVVASDKGLCCQVCSVNYRRPVKMDLSLWSSCYKSVVTIEQSFTFVSWNYKKKKVSYKHYIKTT